jgi:hypothetical protein
MKMFASAGCPARRELFTDHAMIEQRQCDGCELNIQTVMMPLQRPLRVVQTYSANDVV